MNDKLKRLAIKMVDLFPSEFSSPQDCYNLFQDIYKKQFDYFSYFEPENLIKLVFYLYSYKTTKDFRLAHFAIDEKNPPRPGDAIISKITKASPNFIVADEAPISIRKTRGGDASAARSKEVGSTAIMVGMPTLSQLKARS